MTTRNRPRPSKAINLREKVRMRTELKLFYGWWIIDGINKPRTLIGDEVE